MAAVLRVAWWRIGYGVGLATQMVAVRLPAVPLSTNNLRQVVHTHAPLSPSSVNCTGQTAMMPYGWEGNRRSGVALAMRYKTSVVYPSTGSMAYEREMSTPPTHSSEEYDTAAL